MTEKLWQIALAAMLAGFMVAGIFGPATGRDAPKVELGQ